MTLYLPRKFQGGWGVRETPVMLVFGRQRLEDGGLFESSLSYTNPVAKQTSKESTKTTKPPRTSEFSTLTGHKINTHTHIKEYCLFI